MMRFSVPLVALGAAACSTAPQAAPPTGTCPVTASSDWTAWVNAMPGEGRPRLIATGKVTVPTGGYSFQWSTARVAESYPVRVAVELQPIAPAGMATQALVTHSVRGEWPSEKRVGSLTIICGGRQLATISPVDTAQ